MKTKPLVVAIAAVSGGGKTTTTKMLQSKLLNVEALYFDDLDFDAESAIDDVCEWVEAGADHSLWELQPLADQITALLSEKSRPIDFILLDYSFAYQQKQISNFIDYAIFIDTPLDIAMGRRILRDFSQEPSDKIRADINTYLMRGRNAYLSMLSTIKPDSDFVIDGSLPLDIIVDTIVKKLIELKANRCNGQQ